MAIEIVEGVFEYCPLIKEDICEGYCYDVQMVRSKMIKESILDFPFDREKADKLCKECSFNQLR